MSARAERPKNRRIRLVGGGYRMSRGGDTRTGGSLKAMRRALRQDLKRKDLTVEARKALKLRLAEMLARKDDR